LASVHPDFAICQWDRLIFQSILTLNLLCNSRVNPKLSAHAYLFGVFDFNKTPLVLPSTKFVMHEKHDKRASWEYHGKVGWYVGPSMEHYPCVKCLDPQSNQVRDLDTVQFFNHSNIKIPNIIDDDYLKQVADDILSILKKPNNNLPSIQSGSETRNALLRIALALKRASPPPTPVQSASVQPIPPLRVEIEKTKALDTALPRVQVQQSKQIPPIPIAKQK
jgi:hypothetical protein